MRTASGTWVVLSLIMVILIFAGCIESPKPDVTPPSIPEQPRRLSTPEPGAGPGFIGTWLNDGKTSVLLSGFSVIAPNTFRLDYSIKNPLGSSFAIDRMSYELLYFDREGVRIDLDIDPYTMAPYETVPINYEFSANLPRRPDKIKIDLYSGGILRSSFTYDARIEVIA